VTKYITWTVSILASVFVVFVGLRTFGYYGKPPPPATARPSTPRAMLLRDLPWPAGWNVSPVAPLSGAVGEAQTAKLIERGRSKAVMTALVGREDLSRPLGDIVKDFVVGETEAATAKGSTASASPPVEATWQGRPALQYEVFYKSPDALRHQRHIVTRGSDELVCSLALTAIGADFDANLAEFERLRDRFPCP
jgi:hypothetical protein